MSAHEQMRAMLDELMGTARDGEFLLEWICELNWHSHSRVMTIIVIEFCEYVMFWFNRCEIAFKCYLSFILRFWSIYNQLHKSGVQWTTHIEFIIALMIYYALYECPHLCDEYSLCWIDEFTWNAFLFRWPHRSFICTAGGTLSRGQRLLYMNIPTCVIIWIYTLESFIGFEWTFHETTDGVNRVIFRSAIFNLIHLQSNVRSRH